MAVDGSKFKQVQIGNHLTRGKVAAACAAGSEAAHYLQPTRQHPAETTESAPHQDEHSQGEPPKLDGEMKRLQKLREERLLASPIGSADLPVPRPEVNSRSNGNEWTRLCGRRLQRPVAVETSFNRNTQRAKLSFRSDAALTC